jgi:eukaryotic-like serine/threonine-protein kinase
LRGHVGEVKSLTYSRDSKVLLSGGKDRVVVVWDSVTGQERIQLTGHADSILHLSMLPRDAGLLSVGRDGSVQLWRADSTLPRPRG